MTSLAGRDGHELSADVAVVGGGLAGLATATHLARDGCRVVCIEPRSWPRPAVGESLEFSAATLLGDLGIEVTSGPAPHLYPKTSVRIVGGGDDFTLWPPTWFVHPPIWCSRLAFHTDRTVLDEELLHAALGSGVDVVSERAALIDRDHDRITGVVTDRGTCVTARWYVDASGHNARVLSRALGLEPEPLGPSRTAYWARFSEPPRSHATTLHFPDPSADDLPWVWEIPLNDAEVSIGTVLSTARLSRLRAGGLDVREIFDHQLTEIHRLRRVAGEHPDVELHATTYAPFVHRRTVGPNWVLVGDAAAMADPLTSNGVTSALRHAQAAARLVLGALEGGSGHRRRAWTYQHTAPSNVANLDRTIETFVYQPRIRRRLGLRWAVNLYAGTGVVTNSLYAKIDPASVGGAAGWAAVLIAGRAWTRVAHAVLSRLVPRRHRAPHAPSSTTTDSARRRRRDALDAASPPRRRDRIPAVRGPAA